jgi:hypothetical protein
LLYVDFFDGLFICFYLFLGVGKFIIRI